MTIKYNDFRKVSKILHAFKETNALIKLQTLKSVKKFTRMFKCYAIILTI